MRFGVVQRIRPRHVYRHGNVVFFRIPNRRRDRLWTIIISLLVMVGMAIPINMLSGKPGGSPESKLAWSLVTFLTIPLMFIVLAIAMPQRSIVISPRGLCVASTFRRRRIWILWDQITGVRPEIRAVCVQSGSLFIPKGGLPKGALREFNEELRKHLELRFDLNHRTTYWQRVDRTRRRWTKAWVIDRACLWGLALTFTAAQLVKCLCCTDPVLAFLILGAFAAVWISFLTIHGRQVDRDNWIPPRHIAGTE